MDANLNCGCFNWLYSVKSPIFASLNNYPHFPLFYKLVSVFGHVHKMKNQFIHLIWKTKGISVSAECSAIWIQTMSVSLSWDHLVHCLKGLGPLIRKAKKLHNRLTFFVTCLVAVEILIMHSAHILGTQVISIFFWQWEYPISWISDELGHIIFHIRVIKRGLMEDECTMSQRWTAKNKEDECWGWF